MAIFSHGELRELTRLEARLAAKGLGQEFGKKFPDGPELLCRFTDEVVQQEVTQLMSEGMSWEQSDDTVTLRVVNAVNAALDEEALDG